MSLSTILRKRFKNACPVHFCGSFKSLSFAAAVKTELNGSSEVEPVTVFYVCMTGCLFVWLSAIALIFRHAA